MGDLPMFAHCCICSGLIQGNGCTLKPSDADKFSEPTMPYAHRKCAQKNKIFDVKDAVQYDREN